MKNLLFLSEPNNWELRANGVLPIVDLDFSSNRYYLRIPTINGRYSVLSALNAAIGGTFTRASTATYYNSAGTLVSAAVDGPRLDHNPFTLESLGLLMEGARTNLCLQSEVLGTTWANDVGGGTTLTENDTVAPDGTATADKIERIDGAGDAIRQTITLVDATTYTVSLFAKNDDSAETRINLADGTEEHRIDVTWTAGTPSLESADFYVTDSEVFENVGNGWWRISWSFLSADTAGALRIYPGTTGSNGQGSWFWGVQLEVAAFVSSYIPTTTVAVTRALDHYQITQTTTPFVGYNQSAGAWVIEIDADNISTSTTVQTIAAFTEGGSNEEVIRYNFRFTDARSSIVDGGVSQTDLQNTNYSSGTDVSTKISGAWSLNDTATVRDGLTAVTDATATMPSPTNLDLGQLGDSAPMFAHIKRFTYFDHRVTNADLVTLST